MRRSGRGGEREKYIEFLRTLSDEYTVYEYSKLL